MRPSLPTRAAQWLGLALIVFGLLFSFVARAQNGDEPAAGDGSTRQPARLEVFVFEGGRPVDDLIVRFGDVTGRTRDGGMWEAEVAPARDRLTLFDNAQALAALPLQLRPGEIVQIIITLKGPERRATVSIESSHGPVRTELADRDSVDPAEAGSGVLTGRVISTEDGEPIADARVFVSGTPIEVRTDAEGRFETEVPAGEYSVSVLHAEFATRTVDGVAIAADETVQRNFELPPAGLELAEFVVVEPFIEGSLSEVVAIRRESTAVTDVLSAEQISRSGDADVGAALKRVTGLTLVDGEFVFVRGLGERYSSVLFNGANLPSPDPTRRVLPLDLFPTDIISRLVVQKTSDASMPGSFGGGTVQMASRTFPEDFLLSVSFSSGYNTAATGETGLTYEGGDRDWTGFDDGSRRLPPSLAAAASDQFLSLATRFNPEGVSPDELEVIGEELAARTDFSNQDKSLPVDRSWGVSLGNSFQLTPEITAGFLASIDYSDKWRLNNEQRATFSATNAGLQLADDLTVQRTLRNIDLSGFLNAGIEFGDWTRLGANIMLLRQSEDEVQFDDGESDNQFLRRFEHEWTENQLFTAQFLGEHTIPRVGLTVDWQFSTGQAVRQDPNTVEYRRDDNNADGIFEFSRRADSNEQTWSEVDDELTDWTVNLSQPLPEFGPVQATISGGLGKTVRDRFAELRRFSFQGNLPSGADQLPQEQILQPENIDINGLRIDEDTQATDNYTAEQDLSVWYTMLELGLFERLTLVGGLRHEENFQRAETDNLSSPDAPPVISEIDDTDDLISSSLTWRILQNLQLRLGFSQTLSRPDLREISPAPFEDPILDLRSVGNPDLEVSSLDNYDARVEYYFNETDSISFAYFLKEIDNPIEKVVSAGASGTTIFLENALSADVEGWEVDVYRSLGFVNDQQWLDRIGMGWMRRIGLENYFVAVNYADITTSVSLDPDASNQTNPNRPLEGASPWVVNAQIGYTSPEETFEWTLLFNSFGERISRAGALGQPDIFEQPFAKLDFTAKYRFRDLWTFKVELENLLDEETEFTQGGRTTRIFKPGVEFSIGLEFRM